MTKDSDCVQTILTPREKEVGAYFIKGMTAKQVARELGLAVSTVQGYQRIIKNKMASKNGYQTGYFLGIILK